MCVQSLLFSIKPTQCPRDEEKNEREKKESEDIERSIGRRTVLPEDTTGNKERGETGENEKEQLLLLLI